MKILGISRCAQYSPNMVDKDARIFNAVAEKLRADGHDVELVTENQYLESTLDANKFDRIYTMARNKDTLRKILNSKDNTPVIINPINGILNCESRYNLLDIFMREDVRMPKCALYNQECVKSDGDVEFPLWIKRGDGCAQQKEDTSYVENPEEASAVVDNFMARGIKSFVIQEHVKGDLVKFYGVEGTDFFDWDYASKGHSKFGLEEINGIENNYPFNPDILKLIADYAAKAANVPIYGGDAVITEHGEIYIIDLNDWPSFSRCYEIASKAIAQRIIKGI